MKIPNWLKITLWVALIAFFTWLLIQRYDAIIRGTSNASDIILFLIWIALIAAFIFQEVDFFGVRLKKEIDNLKSEFKEQIINLRSDIHNTINMRTNISPQIYLTPPTDSELPSIEERIRPVLEQVLKEQGIKSPVQISEPEIPDNARFLFSVRYSIENELKRIWRQIPEFQRKDGIQRERQRSIRELVYGLSHHEIINKELLGLIQDILAIGNQAVHGEDVSEAKVKFVREVAPELIASLRAINVTFNFEE